MNTLTLNKLKELGAFTGAPVEREVTWKMGGEEFAAIVYVRPLSYKSAVSDLVCAKTGRDAVAGRIASCIFDGNGNPVFTANDITGLNDDGSPILNLDEKGNPVQSTDDDGNPILDVDGNPVFEERGSLDGNLTLALLQVIGEVSGLGKSELR